MKKGLAVILLTLLCLSHVCAMDYSSTDVVKEVQQALNSAGFDCGTPDGIAGTRTGQAVSDYRNSKGLTPGTGIDAELYNSLFADDVIVIGEETYAVDLVPMSDEEIASLENVDILAAVVRLTFDEIGVENAEFAGFYNYAKFGKLITCDALYKSDTGKNLVISCMYVEFDSVPWSVPYICDANNGKYYYLNEMNEGNEDVYSYTTGELVTSAISVGSFYSDTAEEDKKAIKSVLTKRIKDNYVETVIDEMTINENLGTTEAGDYIALVYLTWNRKNGAEMTETMLDMFSDDLAVTAYNECKNVKEIALFWKVPYLGDGTSKWSYVIESSGAYRDDKVILW